ncbi:hypothetical protein L596_020411 [Steinernema carpocapsae]|uniref:Glycosyltransferase family 92 protein n=1 Tax=Steinernema carpocapsae TaxID=34508 RepID=A0A4V6A0X1_STECR|nr:hypothetical protein L596_020411 [Steinernema carpocapsae]
MKKAYRLVAFLISFFLLYHWFSFSVFVFQRIRVKPTNNPDPNIISKSHNFTKLNADVYFYTSFVDLRNGNIGFPMVRTIAVLKANRPKLSFYCRFGFDKLVEAHLYELSENHMQIFGTYLISCPIPDFLNPPEQFVIGVGEEKVEIEVTYLIPDERLSLKTSSKFSICVPLLFGKKYSIQDIVEFMELNRLLGAEKIFLYVDRPTLEPQMVKTLQFYESRKLLQTLQYSLPMSHEDIWYHGQLVTVTDCLYRNVGYSKYVAFHDIDEAMVPQGSLKTVPEALDSIANSTIGSYRVPTVIFDIREILPPYKVNAKRRSAMFDQTFTKCILRPEMVYEQGIHHTSRVIQDYYQAISMPSEVMRVHHYKPGHPSEHDDTVDQKYGNALRANYEKITELLKV